MKFKQFIPPFNPHDPSKLEMSESPDLSDVFQARFMAWHYINREKTKAESFSFQVNEGVPTSQVPNPPTHLVNIDMPGGGHYVIGHIWMSDEEAKSSAWHLSRVHKLEEIYTGNEDIFKPLELQ